MLVVNGNVTTVANNNANVSTVAGSIANVNTVAGSIADVNRYAQEYVIQSSTPSSPSAGDLWYNTTANTLNYYSGSSFVGIAPGIASVSADTQPQLGGTLNADNNNITNGGTFTATTRLLVHLLATQLAFLALQISLWELLTVQTFLLTSALCNGKTT